MSSFDYAAAAFNLKEQIRVLTLLPATHSPSNDLTGTTIDIKTTLESFNWADHPSYVALSYTWGDLTLLKPILVNGQTIEITANLYEALCELQSDEAVQLWVDAICINQNDNLEKSEQVKRMTEVYKAATSVFVWLGPVADDSDVAMDGIERIGEAGTKAGILDLSRPVMLKLWDPDPEGTLDSVRKPFQDLSKRIGLDFPQVAIKALAARSYWNRTWIAQEFSVARDLVIACGSKRLSFRQVAAGFLFLALHRALLSMEFAIFPEVGDLEREERIKMFQTLIRDAESGAPCKLVGSRNRYQKQRPDYHSSMIELLSLFSASSQATNPRDKIYGLLGLAPDAHELGIVVDYALKIHQVYAATARALLRNGFTDVLSWCRFPKARSDLPTWVPDFSSPLQQPIGSYKCGTPPWKPLFSTSGSSEVKISAENEVENPGLLTISGLTVDTIEEVGAPWKYEEDYAKSVVAQKLLFSQIVEFWDIAISKPHPVSQDPEFWTEALWRVPCADQQRHEYSRRRAQIGAGDGLMEIMARNNGELSGYSDEVKKTAWQRYHLAMNYLWNVRPFLSTKGYVGLAPEFAAPGDVICVIFGAIVPYVLRKVSDKGYELVGETYVHGIMDGEAMNMGLDEEVFRLS